MEHVLERKRHECWRIMDCAPIVSVDHGRFSSLDGLCDPSDDPQLEVDTRSPKNAGGHLCRTIRTKLQTSKLEKIEYFN